MKRNNPIALIILDGFGESNDLKDNAVFLGKTPNIDSLTKKYPNILMNTSGKFVGLPNGQMGNSEVGHLNIGSGRVMFQSLNLINNEIEKGYFSSNKILLDAISYSKNFNSNVHILGLVSDGGVHSHINHIVELFNIFKDSKIDTYLHAITDGRDVKQKSANIYFDMLKDKNIFPSTIIGRYFAMDRDKKWDRINKAYKLLTENIGESFSDSNKFVESQYKKNIYDEFLEPAYNSNINAKIKKNDVIIFANFRSDRARQLSHMFIKSNVEITNYDFNPTKRLSNPSLLTMREYAGINSIPIYKNDIIKNTLGDVIEQNELTQMRAAETEKYPHVTFFLDGGREVKKIHEKRILVDSPKVPTYDMKPEMSSNELTDKILKHSKDVNLFIINYAQTDMVGHTGNIEAAIKSVESSDKMIGILYEEIVKKMGGTMIITADHGNVERMSLEDGQPCTTHTTNPVKLIITNNNISFKNIFKDSVSAKLADIAATILYMFNLNIPKEITGKILIK